MFCYSFFPPKLKRSENLEEATQEEPSIQPASHPGRSLVGCRSAGRQHNRPCWSPNGNQFFSWHQRRRRVGRSAAAAAETPRRRRTTFLRFISHARSQSDTHTSIHICTKISRKHAPNLPQKWILRWISSIVAVCACHCMLHFQNEVLNFNFGSSLPFSVSARIHNIGTTFIVEQANERTVNSLG